MTDDEVRRWALTHGWSPTQVVGSWTGYWSHPVRGGEFFYRIEDRELSSPGVPDKLRSLAEKWVERARTCKHEDFVAQVDVDRVADDGKGDEIVHFVAAVTVTCTACEEQFGFRGPPAGHSWSEPRVAVDARKVHLPLMSPAELRATENETGLPAALNRGPMVYEVTPSGRLPA